MGVAHDDRSLDALPDDLDVAPSRRRRKARDRAPLDPTARGVRSVKRFLSLGVLGVVVMLGGLVWDAVIHLGDPVSAHEESGPLDLSNPSHGVLVLGGMLVVGSLTGAWVRARTLLPSRRRPARTAFVAVSALALTGASVVWIARADDGAPQLLPEDPEAAEIHAHGVVNSHDDGPCEPSRAERLGAQRLIADTEAGTARFQDSAVAIAEGYVPGLAADTSDHWLDPLLMGDNSALDPYNPEALIYTQTAAGPVLTGVTYIMNVPGEFGPEVGGCLTRWHVHANLCFSPTTGALVGELRPDDTCPPGGVRHIPPPALHVWLVDIPDGRFAAEIDHDELLEAVQTSTGS